MRLSSLASYGIFSAAAVVVLLNTMYLLDHQRTATSHVDFVRACVEDPEPDRVLPEIFDKPHKPWLLLMCMPILPDKIMQRQRIRSTYMQFPEVECPWCIPRHENPVIRFRFFVATNDSKGNPYPLVLVEEEQRAYGDIVFLNIADNINFGKTWSLFNYTYYEEDADFAMKLDDDAIINIPSLVQNLQLYSRYPDLHYGFGIIESERVYMAGMGFIIGRDLIKYIATGPPKDDIIAGDAGEDFWVAKWIKDAVNVTKVSDRERFHDYPTHRGPVSWELKCSDILIHQSKTNDRWETAIRLFRHCCPPYGTLDMSHPKCQEVLKIPSASCCTWKSRRRCGSVCARALPHLPAYSKLELWVPVNYTSSE